MYRFQESIHPQFTRLCCHTRLDKAKEKSINMGTKGYVPLGYFNRFGVLYDQRSVMTDSLHGYWLKCARQTQAFLQPGKWGPTFQSAIGVVWSPQGNSYQSWVMTMIMIMIVIMVGDAYTKLITSLNILKSYWQSNISLDRYREWPWLPVSYIWPKGNHHCWWIYNRLSPLLIGE